MFEKLNLYALFDEKEWRDLPFNEEFLLKLLRLFVNSVLPKHVVELEDAMKINDWQTLQKIAHTLKTSSYYCGSVRLRHLCAYLETCEIPTSQHELNHYYAQFQSALEKTKEMVEEFLSKYIKEVNTTI